jgi:hypothetical protein
MVAVEPDLGDILKLPVLGNLVGRQVAVVVDDGLRRGVLVVEGARGGRLQQEVVGQERSHNQLLVIVCHCERSEAIAPEWNARD